MNRSGMRIGINACAFNEHPSGAMQRLVGLYRELFKDPRYEYVVFESRDARVAQHFHGLDSVEYVRTLLPSDRTFMRVILSKAYWRNTLPRHHIDVFDTSGLAWVRYPRGVTIHTLHDIRHATHPELYSLKHRLMGRRETRATLRNADAVVTVSETMRAQLLEFEPHAKRVVVVPNAIDWDEQADEAPIFDAPYILAVGHLERRKNYIRLVEAFERVTRAGYCGHLWMIGNLLDDAQRIQGRVAASPERARIHIASRVPRSELARYYRNADLFVFPSLYEGFGIPTLEAMKFGCPFVLSDLPVFREITNNAAVYFDATDVVDMADKMSAMLSSSDLRQNCATLARGAREVYSWKAAARTYSSLLHEFEP